MWLVVSPVFYQDTETDEITGIGADLMRTAAMKAGYNVTFRVIKEKTLKEALDNKDYDVVMPFGSAVASSKGQPSIVSDNLMQTPFTLVTEGNHETPPLNKLRVVLSLTALCSSLSSIFFPFPSPNASFMAEPA